MCNGLAILSAAGGKASTHGRLREGGGGLGEATSGRKMVARPRPAAGSSCSEEAPVTGARVTREDKSRLVLLVGLILSILCLVSRSWSGVLLQPGDEKGGVELFSEPPQQGREEDDLQDGLRAAGRSLQYFPTVTNSTILFLHVFKVGGCSLAYAALHVCLLWLQRCRSTKHTPQHGDSAIPSSSYKSSGVAVTLPR